MRKRDDEKPRPKDREARGEMRWTEVRAPGALYHSGTDDDTDIGYGYDLRDKPKT
jgi:hypothetical protein